MKPILAILAAALAPVAVALSGAALADEAATSGPVLVELFTSQGCSSCPPADQLLGELSRRPGVVAIGFHVDYWDYIGWKDPFAGPWATQRQRSYAHSLGLHMVYTPQVVIDGRADAVGSDRATVDRLIERAAATPKLPIRLETDGGMYHLVLPQTKLEGPATIWMAVFDPKQRTAVARGENSGRDLTDYNVVRTLHRLASWDGSATRLDVDIDTFMGKGQGCAILVQADNEGAILAALAVPPGESDQVQP